LAAFRTGPIDHPAISSFAGIAPPYTLPELNRTIIPPSHVELGHGRRRVAEGDRPAKGGAHFYQRDGAGPGPLASAVPPMALPQE
jgi:hypothetical protein